jgi:hypothetical protein
MRDGPLTRAFVTCCQCLLLLSIDDVKVVSAATTVYRVSFLGYVEGGPDTKNLSAVILLDGKFDNRPVSWRATRRKDVCGGHLSVDFFDALEFPVGYGNLGTEGDLNHDTVMVQVLLSEDRRRWNDNVSLFLCFAPETGPPGSKWLALGQSTMFTLPVVVEDYIANEATHLTARQG